MYVSVLVCYALVAGLVAAQGFEYNSQYLKPQDCKTCDAMSCPELIYCAGKKVKDNCGCCERCSSDLFQPHAQLPATTEDKDTDIAEPVKPKVDACEARKCPRFKVCMINIQGLPICTCPTRLVCDPRRKRKNSNGVETTVCGSDGITYESRCHMRVANCEKGKRIRRKHAGACLIDVQTKPSDEAQLPTTFPVDDDTEEDRVRLKAIEKVKRRRQKRKKLKERRKKKKERKMKKNKEKRRRMKRRNNNYNMYSNHYGKMIGRYTKWGRSQVRKSRI